MIDELADVFEDDLRIQGQLLTRALEGDGSFRIVLLDPHASERTSTCQSAVILMRWQHRLTGS